MKAFNKLVKTFGFFDPSIEYDKSAIVLDGKKFTKWSDLYKYCKSKKYKYINTPTIDGFGIYHVTGGLDEEGFYTSAREEDHEVTKEYDTPKDLIDDCERRLCVDEIYLM